MDSQPRQAPKRPEPSFDAVIDVEAAVKDAGDPAWSCALI